MEPQSDVSQGGRHPPPLPNRNLFLICIGPGEGARSFPVHLSREIVASPESAGICDRDRHGYSLRSTTPYGPKSASSEVALTPETIVERPNTRRPERNGAISGATVLA